MTVTATPTLVEQAYTVARQEGFPLSRAEAGPSRPSACLPGVGRFLAVLAAGCHGGTIGELGTGIGIGAAWIASAMPADCSLVTAELDPGRAAAAAGCWPPTPVSASCSATPTSCWRRMRRST